MSQDVRSALVEYVELQARSDDLVKVPTRCPTRYFKGNSDNINTL